MSAPKDQPPNLKLRFFISCFIAIVCLLAAFPPTLAAGDEPVVIYVKHDASGNNNGTSWGDAYNDLQDALEAASGKRTEIRVAEGTYKPANSSCFDLLSNVALYGGFKGAEVQRSDRDYVTNVTTLNGSGKTVVLADGMNETSVLDGFTITGGNASMGSGGGMHINGGNPTVTNCTFSENDAINGGGGMYINTGTPTVTNCTFSGNTATSGGGVYIISGLPTFTNCTFSANEANGGGGMYIKDGSPTLTNCTFQGNNTNMGSGGGMYVNGGYPMLTNCIFSGNNAFYGGGMYTNGGSSTLTNCTFSKNMGKRGGGMFIMGGSPTVTSCTFEENAAGLGGGMLIGIASLEMTNCTFWKNEVTEDGGGMYIQEANSNPTLTNCTFSKNTATNGNGMFIVADNKNSTVTNTIFWGTDSAAGQVVDLSTNLTITCSVTDLSGQGNTNADPELGPLADNGGPTKTHALSEGSSAIDSGTSTGAPDTDQRGVPRPQGVGVDMGAYERVPEQPDSPEVDPGPDSPEGSGGGGCLAGPASPWTLALLAPLASLALRKRPGRRGR
ncbi:MAG: right-handed parallel beta-helix repeat-containing protein [Aminivibrio sp.]|jgi:parallel beta-helix repeat protein